LIAKILKKLEALSRHFRYLVWCLVVGETVVIGVSLAWNLEQIKQKFLEIARAQAVITLEKDVISRHWSAGHGGVYVPMTNDTPPNPYLAHIPERDITTPSGEKLTLINPAYMMRQIYEIEQKGGYTFLGHITSLNPIRPQNAPDPWERKALEAFERGKTEVSALETIAGKEYFRLMHPLRVEESCLKCHAAQGYKEGDIRGGISVSILMEPLLTIMHKRIYQFTISHIILWLIGLGGIALITQFLIKSEKVRQQAEEVIHNSSITDELTSLLNRRGFFTLAEQQLKIARRTGREMVLLFADLDKLKLVNDTLGHAEGDQALRETATILKNTFRESDIIARIGGDEFVMLAVETPENNAGILRKHLQEKVDAYNSKENVPYKLSLSFGVVRFDPRVPATIDELLIQADAVMYEEKQGKNSSA
jgi:diguanylate cyclase (GGDEF)-like protein